MDGVRLTSGRGEALPFRHDSFDLLYVVNALHHFDDQPHFFVEARRILRPGGTLIIIGLDVQAARDRWMVYEYFPGTYERDRERYPAWTQVTAWMQGAGLSAQPPRGVERIREEQHGRAVLDNPFLQKHGTSQLALLTDEAYAAGMARIRAAVEAGEARGEKRCSGWISRSIC